MQDTWSINFMQTEIYYGIMHIMWLLIISQLIKNKNNGCCHVHNTCPAELPDLVFFIHLKLELLMACSASNDKKFAQLKKIIFPK